VAVTGRKPKDEAERRNRMPAVHDWTEVDDVPYSGVAPKLPTRYRLDPETGVSMRASWPEATKRWWAVVSKMPHCTLWTATDWEFALQTAEVHARFTEGTNGTELRIREKLLGTTLDARRDLRIRYVTPKVQSAGGDATVTSLDAYRGL
jgi:hypothetical protein